MNEQMIKPYGDTVGDGIVQLSFTLPVSAGARAVKAAEMYAAKLNLTGVRVCHHEEIADGFTYFVLYGRAAPVLDYATVQVSDAGVEKLDFYQINELIENSIERKVVVVGATIGSDAHTVGIDAIMNMKGYNMDYGLERYPQIKAFNMGAQVTFEELKDKALEENADAILVSQTVSQKDSHIHNFSGMIDLLKREKIRDRFLVIAGGPRVSWDLAVNIGYDAGFGPGTLPSHVASFIAAALVKKLTPGVEK